MSLLAERCRVVLVRPRIAANLGATARCMTNFGLRQLVLVQPHPDPLDPGAKQLSTRGEVVLHEARSVPTLAEAIGDCVLVVGTSARLGGLFRKQNVVTPREMMPQVVETLARGPVALVFGPEANGLTNEEVVTCHHLVTIPADEAYPVLNLAQAVAVCMYELHQAWRAVAVPPPVPEPRADAAAQALMFRRLEKALYAVHYLWDERSAARMHALRHMLGRARMTAVEVDLLLGLARQLMWFVKNRSTVEIDDEETRPA